MTKKAVSLEIDSEPLAQAQSLGLDLSAALGSQILRAVRWAKWREEKRDSIEAHNKRIKQYGLWSDGFRLF